MRQKTLGLPAWMRALRLLKKNEHKNMTTTSLYKLGICEMAWANKIIKIFEEKKIVTRKKIDGRTKKIFITEKGERINKSIQEIEDEIR